jgi:hypothetical protein
LPALIEEAGDILHTYHEHVRSNLKQNYKLLNASLALSAEILSITEVIVARFELTGCSECSCEATVLHHLFGCELLTTSLAEKIKHIISATLKHSEHTEKLKTSLDNLKNRTKELRRIADQLQREVTKETGDRVEQLAIKEDLSKSLVDVAHNAACTSNQRLGYSVRLILTGIYAT